MMESKAGIYIHIPFCVRKCNYCAFLSAPGDEEGIENYVNALIDEIYGCKENFTSVDTVYFGGGTPSLLTSEKLGRILNALREKFPLESDTQITLEANPGTLGSNDSEVYVRLSAYRKLGINRLSMGVQSMNDEVLKYLGRIHNAEEVRRDFQLARKAGFDNINLDLILSVPYIDNIHNDSNVNNINNDSDVAFNNKLNTEYLLNAERDVTSITEMNPEHISCYSLQIEEGTPFGNMYEEGLLHEIPDELDREIYHRICDILTENGYEHYEISNFAKPGFESRHNSKYWNMADYLGLGLGASGFVNGVRYKNTEDMREYLAGNYIAEEYKNTEHDNISEAVFTGLRRKVGIRYDEIFKGTSDAEQAFWDYYKDARTEAENFAQSGHLIIDRKGLRLTESGIDISNKIMALFV